MGDEKKTEASTIMPEASTFCMNSFFEFNIKESFIMSTFITGKCKHMHEFGKFIGLQIKLFRNGCFICRLHVFVEIFNFTKGKYVNKDPQRNVAMFSHVMGYYLMMFTHLSSNFLLDISYKLN